MTNASAQGAWAAVTDLFRAMYLEADQEERVALLNNYWQVLWRSAAKAKLDGKSPVMLHLDAVMGQWVEWKRRYDAAVLVRWVPYATHDWNSDLDDWAKRYTDMVAEVDSYANGLVSSDMTGQGISPEDVSASKWNSAGAQLQHSVASRLNDAFSSSWFWPVLGIVGAMYATSWVIRTTKTVASAV